MSYCSSTVIRADVQNCFGIKLVLKSGQHLDFNAALLTFEMVVSRRCRHASPVQRSWGDCSGSMWAICPLPHYAHRAPWSRLGTSSQEEAPCEVESEKRVSGEVGLWADAEECRGLLALLDRISTSAKHTQWNFSGHYSADFRTRKWLADWGRN